MRRHDIIRGNRHAAVVMGSTVEHMIGAQVRDPHQRIVGRVLAFVAVHGRLRHAVEANPPQLIRFPGMHGAWSPEDYWRPLVLLLVLLLVVVSVRRVDLY